MRVLADTQALLWWWTDDAGMSLRARELMADPAVVVLVSAASAWEIATKQRLGKLSLVPDAAARLAELVALDGFEHLPVTYRHALRADGLDWTHRDPFDRMLAAQSALEQVPLLSSDGVFVAHGIEVVW